MTNFPVGRGTTIGLFRPVEVPRPPHVATLDPDARNLCRWCLERFDPQMQKERSIWERGQLRTNLKMHDNGSELVICDNCWDAIQVPQFVRGQTIDSFGNPEVIPNLLLRKIVEG